MFINISNHPSVKWDSEQLSAAQKFGEVVDVPFPAVPATANTKDVINLAASVADQVLAKINTNSPCVAMVQGEFTLAAAIVKELQAANIKCVAACSDRNTQDLPDGRKLVTFKFVQFREYPDLATRFSVVYK